MRQIKSTPTMLLKRRLHSIFLCESYHDTTLHSMFKCLDARCLKYRFLCDMVLRMGITINIQDALYLTAKQKAAQRKMTLSAFVEEALMVYFASVEKTEVQIPTAGKGGLRPGVDLNQSTVLMDIMEEIA